MVPLSEPSSSYPVRLRLDRLLAPDYPLCRDDVVWVLDYIKKKVAGEDPALLDLPQPRLLRNYRLFAEAAMLLIHRRPGNEQEIDRLRLLLAEAVRDFERPLA
ncbi:hypothetical protein [Paenibacillus sp. 32O-W]|uniref:hypothetical protein n=1 Tax=Paenibacillus sp. 32O-W TaxID=1695218 RepID=UPI003FA5BAA9